MNRARHSCIFVNCNFLTNALHDQVSVRKAQQVPAEVRGYLRKATVRQLQVRFDHDSVNFCLANAEADRPGHSSTE